MFHFLSQSPVMPQGLIESKPQGPPSDFVHNEPKFEVEAVLKSRQLRGQEQEYLVK
jgi:hypothetical protein